jgi:hypothetical protein
VGLANEKIGEKSTKRQRRDGITPRLSGNSVAVLSTSNRASNGTRD